MRASSKAWQVQRSVETINGIEFQDKIMMFDNHGYLAQEPVLYGEGRLLAKNIRK